MAMLRWMRWICSRLPPFLVHDDICITRRRVSCLPFLFILVFIVKTVLPPTVTYDVISFKNSYLYTSSSVAKDFHLTFLIWTALLSSALSIIETKLCYSTLKLISTHSATHLYKKQEKEYRRASFEMLL